MSLLPSAQGEGRAGKPLIRALHLGNADTGWDNSYILAKTSPSQRSRRKDKNRLQIQVSAKSRSAERPRSSAAGGVPPAAWDTLARRLALQRPAYPPRHPPPPQKRREKPSQSRKPRCCGNPIPRSSQAEKGGGWEGHWPPLTSPKATLRCWDTSPNPLRAGTPSPATAVTQWDCADPGRPRLSTPSKAQTVELSGLLLPGSFVKGRHHIGSGRQGIHRSPDLL